jgi:hypothetical protein
MMELANWAVVKRTKRVLAFSQQARRCVKVDNVEQAHGSLKIALKKHQK